MIVHYVKQFYPGPRAVGPQQPRKLVAALARRGHQVFVVASDFNAYDERAEPEEAYAVEGGGSVRVLRLPAPRGMRKNLGARLRTYGAFAAATAWAQGRLPRPDVVIGSIQPLFSAVAALGRARRAQCPFVLEVRDLWPDALEAKGAISAWAAAPLHAMANTLYRSADRVLSLTPGIKTELCRKGLRADRVDVFPNGFDPALFSLAADAAAKVRARYGWGEQFVALYTGTHTEVTAIDVIVRAAAALGEHPNIRVDLFGQGQTKAGAVALAQKLGLSNIHFHDPVPKAEIPAIIAAADVGLMTLFRSPLEHIYFENKLMDYLGAGLPIAAAMRGEQADLIRLFDCGSVVDAFDAEGLAQLILQAAADPARARASGTLGREMVRTHFVLDDILTRYVQRIEEVAGGLGSEREAWEPQPIHALHKSQGLS